MKPTYAPGGGEQGDDFADVPRPSGHAETCATRYPRGPGLGLGPCDCSRELMDHVRSLARSHSNDSDLGAAVRALLNSSSP